jgi:hypothetical protein
VTQYRSLTSDEVQLYACREDSVRFGRDPGFTREHMRWLDENVLLYPNGRGILPADAFYVPTPRITKPAAGARAAAGVSAVAPVSVRASVPVTGPVVADISSQPDGTKTLAKLLVLCAFFWGLYVAGHWVYVKIYSMAQAAESRVAQVDRTPGSPDRGVVPKPTSYRSNPSHVTGRHHQKATTKTRSNFDQGAK